MPRRAPLNLIRRLVALFKPTPGLWSIKEWAAAADKEAQARLQHKKVRPHQLDKQRALHKALKGKRP